MYFQIIVQTINPAKKSNKLHQIPNFKTTIDVHIFIPRYSYLFSEVGYSVATLKIIACSNERIIYVGSTDCIAAGDVLILLSNGWYTVFVLVGQLRIDCYKGFVNVLFIQIERRDSSSKIVLKKITTDDYFVYVICNIGT